MPLADDLDEIAARAGADAVLAAEAQPGERIYVCAFEEADGERTWLAYDAAGEPVTVRQRVRDAVSIVALCELAEETAAGGDLDELRSQLAALRVSESPPGIEEAEEAALALQRVLGTPPTVATPARLDEIGAATRSLEIALAGATQGSPFAAAMKGASEVVDALWSDVESAYRLPLS
jgi:YD repeat-containing protein